MGETAKKSSGEMTTFLLKRLMSITGMIPVGGFLIQHLFSNSYIFNSVEAWEAHSEFLTSLPVVVLIELAMIYFPIALHATLGLTILYRGENNFTNYSVFRNWMFFLQRVSGVLSILFISTHSYMTRIKSYIGGYEMTAAAMSHILSDPFWFWFYLIGVVMAVFHFSNGLWSFLITWGITSGRKAQRVSAALTMGLFVFLALWSISILLKFM